MIWVKQSARFIGYKLKILQVLEKKFLPPLGGLLCETKFSKCIVSPTFTRMFSTQNPAVFLKIDLEFTKRMNTRQVRQSDAHQKLVTVQTRDGNSAAYAAARCCWCTAPPSVATKICITSQRQRSAAYYNFLNFFYNYC